MVLGWRREVSAALICCLACSLRLRAQCLLPQFGSPNYFPAGPTVVTVESAAVGDFNGDGHLDIVVPGQGSRTVSILLGTGDGSFQIGREFSTGEGPGIPRYVAVGDFNGDGRLDLAVSLFNANTLNGSVAILLGQGNGSFDSPRSFPVGIAPTFVVVADFNNDGKLDVAVLNHISNVSILLGDGTGGFGTATNWAVGNTPVSLAVGDFNRDGRPDLVVANAFSERISILLGTGTGGFRSMSVPTEGSPGPLVVGDFNGDSIEDLVVLVANSVANIISVYLGDGAGGFGQPLSPAIQPAGTFVTADFNGDGFLDLVVQYGTNDIAIYLGTGTGAFTGPTPIFVGLTTTTPTVGDFNGDGKPDLVVPNFGFGSLSILLNTCATPHPRQPLRRVPPRGGPHVAKPRS
jgi:VCBS repeat protein